MVGPMWRSGIIAMAAGLLILAAPAITSSGSHARPSAGRHDAGHRPAFAADDLLPLREDHCSIEFLEGDKRGQSAVQSMRPSERGHWVVEIPGHHRTILSRSERGDIVLLGEELPGEGYAFRYDPPPVVVPARVEPGHSAHQRGEIRVYDLDDGGQLRHTSEYEHSFRVRGVRSISTEDGRQNAVIIRTTRRADLGPAEVETEIEEAYVPGTGRIYQRTVTETAGGPLGLWTDTTIHALQRRER